MPKTAVVILNWNGKELLRKFLPTLIENTTSPETLLYVADNGSKDDSVSYIRKEFPQIKTLLLEQNFGFAEGYNRALTTIDADFFVLLNSDVEVTPNWLEPLIKVLDEEPETGACQPKIKSYDQKTHFEYAGAAGGFLDKFGYPFCQGRIFNIIEKDTGQYNTKREIFWATGACLAIKADLYRKAGGLDKDFFAHMEEIDLCWRLKNMGYSIKYIPDSHVFHVGGGTLNMGSPHKTYLNFRNNLLLLYKNLSPGKMAGIFFTRMLLDGVAGIKFLLGGEFSFFTAVFKAHFSFYGMIGKFRKKRKYNIRELSIVFDHKEIYPQSIVYNFFVKKIRKFTDLKF